MLIDKFAAAPKTALFYVNETAKNGWSRSVLLNFLSESLPKDIAGGLPSIEEIESEISAPAKDGTEIAESGL